MTKEDGKYLETFNCVEVLCMNQTGLRSLENLPAMPLLCRFELMENKLAGEELKNLAQYADSLIVLKLASNKFTTLEQMKHLVSLLFHSQKGKTILLA